MLVAFVPERRLGRIDWMKLRLLEASIGQPPGSFNCLTRIR